MEFTCDVLNITERTLFSLRSLYSRYGYQQYRMSKFEEYDLYSRNKDFLVSDSVITFTDTNGRLMALKPDVTLSIVKNVKDLPGTLHKLCYNESVYRVSQSSGSFREILQTGLECIGKVDSCCIGEVLWLAAGSLEMISPDFVLEISHLGVMEALVNRISEDASVRQAVLKCVGEKNLHGIDALCRRQNIPEALAAPLKQLLSLYGSPARVLPAVEALCEEYQLAEAAAELRQALSVFTGSDLFSRIQIDFSVVCDPNYYNGIVFKGFINGVPESVLSGGQYDRLMQRMGRSAHAIGFAVYLDVLERFTAESDEYDADIMLLYDDTAEPSGLRSAMQGLIDQGKRVLAGKAANPRLKFRQLAQYQNGGVVFLEPESENA